MGNVLSDDKKQQVVALGRLAGRGSVSTSRELIAEGHVSP
jgi:hypothetical protein